ncbi:type I secretion system permease/ATPase [Alsobacter sp. SYSU M60028]|uniref:Type I secretion system permease/ATPase n=1 Tax=Alsobacter ponti TaxID=2962936 RepID=A0ABT1LDY9_9HYPH|nr:type I secretion system permease/ATPase [Alsobacter ponti]MCP8939313.1 type I secretion system permease/ATPase [Alsobacter ponti]
MLAIAADPSPGSPEPGERASEAPARIAAASDALLTCLQFLARHYDKPSSETTLTAGLPLDNGLLTDELLPRAAHRVGLVAAGTVRRLSDFNAIDLPAIVFLKGHRPVVLLSLSDRKPCRVFLPHNGGVSAVPFGELADLYEGSGITVAPHYDAQDFDGERPTHIQRGHWFWGPVKSQRKAFVTVCLAALMINLIGLAAPLFTMNVYDRVLPNKAISTLWVLALGFAVVLLFDFILKLARAVLLDTIGKKLDIQLSEAIFEKILNTPLKDRPSSTGEFVNRVTQYEYIREFFTSNTVAVFIDCSFLFIFFLVIYQISGWLVVFPMVATALVIAAGLIAQKMIGEKMAASQAESSLRHAMLVEAVGALETIKGIRAEGALLRRWDNIIRTASVTQEQIKTISSTAIYFSLLLQQLVTVFVVIGGTYSFAEGQLSTGAIIATVMLASRAVAPLTSVATTLTRARHAFAAMRTLNGLMDSPDERISQKNFVNRPVEAGAVQIRNGVFYYPHVQRRILDGINLSIRPGEKVGVIGRVGSGKTTLGRLIAGLYPLTDGELLIDGVDVRQYHPHEVRKAVAIVSQDTDLFLGSVKENILMARPNATDEELVRACKLAGVDDFVSQHPMGYDMPAGERGRNLSTGQRQAVAIARAFLIKPKILFLDEPSSSMDLATERVFLARLQENMPADQTLLIATHRYSMLALVDRLIVVENGRIAADGPKETVLNALRNASAGSA